MLLKMLIEDSLEIVKYVWYNR